jgi:hypothetical protein
MRLAKRVVRGTFMGSKGVVRLRRGQGTFALKNSVFCAVREPFDWPLCVFYSAAFVSFAGAGRRARRGPCGELQGSW